MGLALATAISIPFHHVGLINLFDYNGTDRNDPVSIRRRMAGLLVSNLISIVSTCVVLGVNSMERAREVFGLSTVGMGGAAIAAGLHTAILYAPNIIDYCKTFEWSQFKQDVVNLENVRDVAVAPLAEEIAFRACAGSLVATALGSTSTAVWTTPWLFALSHLHLIGDDMRKGYDMRDAVMRRGFQVAYSYAFGAYATALFFRTGHLSAAVVCHMVCNTFGLPLIVELPARRPSAYRTAIIALSVVSLAAFVASYTHFTDPALFR
ncbi:fce-2 [Pristionchus pacificus]|nr:fce-2 [Pristionchus pacificus]